MAWHALLSPRSARWLMPTLIVVLTGLAFINVLQNDFVNWHDTESFVENPNYRGLSRTHLRWMFTTFLTGHYQPLSWMTLGLDYLLWAMNPTGYHLTNLLLHIANALLVYFVSLRLMRFALSSPQGVEEFYVRLAAGFAALIFSLHPLRVESVAWATMRRDILFALFVLWAVICYLRSVEGRATGSDRRPWMRLALIFYFLSLLSKAGGTTLPLALLVLDVYPLRRLGGGPGKWFGPPARPIWWEKVPFLLLAAGAGIVATIAQYQSGAMESLDKHGFLPRVAQSLFGLAFFLWKLVLPVGLSPLYELPARMNSWDWMFLLSGLVVLIVSAGLFAFRRDWPTGLASWLYYIVILAPLLGIVQSGPQIAADRYTYLACLGWAMVAGGGVYFLWQLREAGRIGRHSFLSANSVVVAVLISLGILTWKQTHVWHDSEKLWTYVVSIRPESAFAHNNLGNALSEQGRLDEAVDQYRRALQIGPKDQNARYNLGNALAKQGKLEEAIKEFRQVLNVAPRSAKARYDLGTALAAQGRSEEAIQELQQVMQIDPTIAKAYYNLGAILAKQGKLQEAIAHFQQAARIDPDYAKAHYNLAFVQARRGELGEAIEHYRQALKLSPGEFEIHFNYAIALAKQGDLDEAVTQFQEALRIKPDFAQGYHNLGTVLMAQGKVGEAIDSFGMALRIQPEFAEAHESLGGAFAAQGKRDEAKQHYQAALRILNAHPKGSARR